YLRQLDIPGVDTKFIEAHRGLLMELLDVVLPEAAVDRTAVGVRAFNARYGLRSEPALMRFRLLDPALYVQGRLSDLSLPAEEFAALELGVRRVVITENRTKERKSVVEGKRVACAVCGSCVVGAIVTG